MTPTASATCTRRTDPQARQDEYPSERADYPRELGPPRDRHCRRRPVSWNGRFEKAGPIDAMGRAARDGNFVAVSNRWSASDAPAERLEQVPRRPGPK